MTCIKAFCDSAPVATINNGAGLRGEPACGEHLVDVLMDPYFSGPGQAVIVRPVEFTSYQEVGRLLDRAGAKGYFLTPA